MLNARSSSPSPRRFQRSRRPARLQAIPGSGVRRPPSTTAAPCAPPTPKAWSSAASLAVQLARAPGCQPADGGHRPPGAGLGRARQCAAGWPTICRPPRLRWPRRCVAPAASRVSSRASWTSRHPCTSTSAGSTRHASCSTVCTPSICTKGTRTPPAAPSSVKVWLPVIAFESETAVRYLAAGIRQIDAVRDPRLATAAVHNLLWCLVDCGRLAEAQALLGQARKLSDGPRRTLRQAPGALAGGADRRRLWRRRLRGKGVPPGPGGIAGCGAAL